jgi:hypothetical protein
VEPCRRTCRAELVAVCVLPSERHRPGVQRGCSASAVASRAGRTLPSGKAGGKQRACPRTRPGPMPNQRTEQSNSGITKPNDGKRHLVRSSCRIRRYAKSRRCAQAGLGGKVFVCWKPLLLPNTFVNLVLWLWSEGPGNLPDHWGCLLELLWATRVVSAGAIVGVVQAGRQAHDGLPDGPLAEDSCARVESRPPSGSQLHAFV